jgi:peptidoglycan/LPS O-acetylase OafA/YrhL
MLDGIRAVAVLAVIAYHFNYGWAQGGFLGVDVFFVLSGYLITSLLLTEREKNGRIALTAFWIRRAKRLLPALFVMLIAVAIWVGANTPPFEISMRRDDLISTLLYYANWHFVASGQGYFVQFLTPSPLRHTWSLAIEEQFYLIWPIICAVALMLASGKRRIIAAVCVVGLLGSAIAMAALYVPGDPSRAYYGTDARMHQLLIGALLAVLMGQLGSLRLRRFASVVGPVAALTLLISFVLLPDQASVYYQGLSVGLAFVTAALVWSVEISPHSLLGRALSLRPMAWIGEISYGLYLWHWPIIIAIVSPTGPFIQLPSPWGISIERLILTFGLATTSFYLLEQPIQRGRMPVIGRSVRRFAVATLVAIVAVGGIAFWQTSGAAAVGDPAPTRVCADFSICLRHQGSQGAPVVAVIGDSIALSLDPAFLAISEQRGWTYVLEATGGCRSTHLLGWDPTKPTIQQLNQQCYQKIPGLERQLLDTWHPDVVIDIDHKDVEDATGPDGSTFKAGTPEMLSLEKQALKDLAGTVTSAGAQFIFVQLSPSLPDDCTSANKISTSACRLKVDSTHQAYYSMFLSLSQTVRGFLTFSLNDMICPGNVCTPVVNGIIVRYDGVHFTQQANLWLASTIYSRIVNATDIR